MTKEIKWRGIPTTTKHLHEKTPKTIKNRYGQLTLSMPRIDDKKPWAGYPGVTGISRVIIPFIPKDYRYVEPFAGVARIYQELIKSNPDMKGKCILNDSAPFLYNWLLENFTSEIITNVDFTECISYWDSENTFFLNDLPWFKSSYDQKFSSFNRKSVKDYDKELISICSNLKGKFIITTRKENYTMLNSGFNNYYLKSEYYVCGKLPDVLLTTNLHLDLLKVS